MRSSFTRREGHPGNSTRYHYAPSLSHSLSTSHLGPVALRSHRMGDLENPKYRDEAQPANQVPYGSPGGCLCPATLVDAFSKARAPHLKLT